MMDGFRLCVRTCTINIHYSIFPLFPPSGGFPPSSNVTSAHLLCHTIFSVSMCVCASVRVSQCVTFKYAFMIPREFFFFFNLKTRMTACSCVLPRPHRDVPFHVLTLPGPAACWRKSPEESAQMLGWCCVLKRIMINVIWHRRVL